MADLLDKAADSDVDEFGGACITKTGDASLSNCDKRSKDSCELTFGDEDFTCSWLV